MGKRYKKDDDNICYYSDLNEISNNKYNIIYINTSLQYLWDYKKLFIKLLSFEPIYFIFTRLIAGDIPNFVTCQNIHGVKTPCQFINYRELVNFFAENNYDLIFKAPCTEESLKDRYDNNIPKEIQIPFTLNIIFMKRS
jgi:putative methyltransferase (TIGR04325 family)